MTFFPNLLSEEMKKNRALLKDISEKFDASFPTVRRWASGKSKPEAFVEKLVCDYIISLRDKIKTVKLLVELPASSADQLKTRAAELGVSETLYLNTALKSFFMLMDKSKNETLHIGLNSN